MTNLVCPECKGQIQMGVAIDPKCEPRFCFMGPILLNHETIEVIDVYKCKSCGYSCDNEYDLMEVK